MSYSKIVNPRTGRKVSVNGKLGREILKQYMNVLVGGSLIRDRDELKQRATAANAALTARGIAQQEELDMMLNSLERATFLDQGESESKQKIARKKAKIIKKKRIKKKGLIKREKGIRRGTPHATVVSSKRACHVEMSEETGQLVDDPPGCAGLDRLSTLESPEASSPPQAAALEDPCDKDMDELRLSWGTDPEQKKYKEWMCACKNMMCDDDSDEEEY